MNDPRLTEFVLLFNERHFFEAHEVLENLWLESHGDDRTFYKGLIQLAVAFAHLQRRNFRGGKQVYLRAIGFLSPYAPVYQDINLSRLLEECHPFFADSESQDVLSLKTPTIGL